MYTCFLNDIRAANQDETIRRNITDITKNIPSYVSCVYSREADTTVLPKQCDISSGHDALQPGQRLLLEERVWQGPQVPASGNQGNNDIAYAGSGNITINYIFLIKLWEIIARPCSWKTIEW